MNIQQFWESVLAQDEQKIRTYFHPKAYVGSAPQPRQDKQQKHKAKQSESGPQG